MAVTPERCSEVALLYGGPSRATRRRRGRAGDDEWPAPICCAKRGQMFFFNPACMMTGEKIVLGHKIPAGAESRWSDSPRHSRAPAGDCEVHSHQARTPFRFDSPPPALVDRVAATFLRSNGDIRELCARSSSRLIQFAGSLPRKS